jgi:hypothetical protein
MAFKDRRSFALSYSGFTKTALRKWVYKAIFTIYYAALALPWRLRESDA